MAGFGFIPDNLRFAPGNGPPELVFMISNHLSNLLPAAVRQPQTPSQLPAAFESLYKIADQAGAQPHALGNQDDVISRAGGIISTI
jgi:hypothetical protein